MKEINDDMNKWKDILFGGYQKNQYCQNAYTTQGNLQIQWNHYPMESLFQSNIGITWYNEKVPRTFFTLLGKKEKKIKFKIIHKRPWVAKMKKNKNGAQRTGVPDFRLYYKTIVIKTVWYWHKNRNIEQWNRTDCPEIDPWTYSQLIYNKRDKTFFQKWKKDSLFNKWCWENWTATFKKVKLDHSLRPYTKINSIWIKVLNVRWDTKTLRRKHRLNILWHKS